MRQPIFLLLMIVLFSACTKNDSARIEIYMLKSYALHTDSSEIPYTTYVSDAVLADAPLVADEDIAYYETGSTTFGLNKDIHDLVKNLGAKDYFVVTRDKQPVYYGQVHPGLLNSMMIGMATFDPLLYNGGYILQIQYTLVNGNTHIQQLDKRNDLQILNPLKSSGRLR